MLLQTVYREGIGVGEQNIVVFPVFPLLTGATRRFSGLASMGMDGLKRKVFVDDLDLIFIRFANFGEFSLNSRTVRSLVV